MAPWCSLVLAVTMHLIALRLAQGAQGSQPGSELVYRLLPGVHYENVTRPSRFANEVEQLRTQELLKSLLQPLNSSSRRTLAQAAPCNYVSGAWVQDKKRRPWYSGTSCPYIRGSYNCMKNGRKDKAYFHYRWKPWGCSIPKFNPYYFLNLLRNKVVAFVGDSISRNFQQAILCQLAAATPSQQWMGYLGPRLTSGVHFPAYNTKIFAVASPFYMRFSSSAQDLAAFGMTPAGGRVNSYVVWLDQPDPAWSRLMPYVDLAIFSGSHWFIDSQGSSTVRSNLFVERGRPLPDEPGAHVYARALVELRKFMLNRANFGGIPVFVTNSPSHYSKSRPSICPWVKPLPGPAAPIAAKGDTATLFHSIEMSLLDGKPFRMVEITQMTLFRADGHVKQFYQPVNTPGLKWDCLHWCLPGVPDSWVDVLHYVLQSSNSR